jgi:hypothetical protein
MADRASAPGPESKENCVRWLSTRPVTRLRRLGEVGMTTAEYAVGTIAACAFAGVLLAVVRSDAVRGAIASVITTALGAGS